jgi:molybdenum cofactor cytidylyltransferase
MARSPAICGIILAAGSSVRMGRDKALLPWPPGTVSPQQAANRVAGDSGPAGGGRDTFLGAWIRLFQQMDMVIVVGGKNSSSLAPVVYSLGAFLVENRTPELGQFSSVKLGLQEVLSHGRDSALVAPVDRPPVQAPTLATLHSAFLGALEQDFWAVVPEYEGRHGHPCLLSREMIEAMLRAPLTATARDIMHANQQRIRYVPVQDPRVVLNIDTQEDYERLAVENT